MTKFVLNIASNSGESKSKVDYEGMNKEIINTVKAEKKKSVVGVVSGLIHLGKQPQEDAKMKWEGSEEAEREAIVSYPETYFENGFDDKGNPCRFKRWPQKPLDAVAITVDFPQYLVDKGKYFGEENSKPLPFRMLLNGEFVPKGGKYGDRTLGRPFFLKSLKRPDGKWSIKDNNTLYKMCTAAGVIEDKAVLNQEDLTGLIGKPLMFEICVQMREGKFYDEYIKFVGSVPEGLPIPECPEDVLYLVQINQEDTPETRGYVKQLRLSVRNQLKRATNYEGSVLESQINELFSYQQNSSGSTTEVAHNKDVQQSTESDDLDDDSDPFDF